MRLLKKIWFSLAVLIVVFAVFSSIFRSLTPWMKQYKGEVEHYLSQLTGQSVSIQKIETGWYWFHPVLKLHQLSLGTEVHQPLKIDKFYIGIDLFKSLLTWRIEPGLFYLEGLHLVLRQNKGQWRLEGFANQALNQEGSATKTSAILAWVLKQEALIFKKISLFFYSEDGGLIPIHDLNISVANRSGYYKIKGLAQLKQTNPSSFELLGKLSLDPKDLHKTKGQFYLAAKNLILAQWQGFIPKKMRFLSGGTGDLAVWLDVNKGLLSALQAQGHLNHLVWHLPEEKGDHLVQELGANLAFKPKSEGWQLDADHIQLRVGGLDWPENQLSLKYERSQERYQFFIKNILLDSLVSQNLPWPAFLEKILRLKPQGFLTKTQVFIKEKQISSFITRFEQLGWEAEASIPKLRHLSGVLNWQPEEGRLELDSEQVFVQEQGYPALNFSLVNGALDWKELSQGLRLSIERLVLSSPNLTLTAEGAFDEVTAQSLGHMRLSADFSAKNLERYAAFMPKQLMKPKLYAWLFSDLKRIEKSSGKITVNGSSDDFPFDQTPGVFSIKAHAEGGALQVNSEWPVIKDIDADIQVNKRDLNIDISKADIQGVPVKQMNVHIADIGHDKESLLIHGVLSGSAQKMKAYVLATPLKNKLNILNKLGLSGSVLLNLGLEIPLYPENDDILVQGDLNFKSNLIRIKHYLKNLQLEETSGKLDFDEHGIRQSSLSAKAFGSLLSIHILSEKNPKPITAISVQGSLKMPELKRQFHEAYLSSLKGSFPFNALLKLSHETEDLESINLKSTLKGLKIDLPKPLGKKQQESLPIEADFDFNTKNPPLIHAKFQDIALKAKRLVDASWSFQVEQKNLAADLNYNQESHNLSGVFKRLHIDNASFLNESEWRASVGPGQIPNLNLRIEQCSLGSIELGAISLKSHSKANQLVIDECTIDAPVYQMHIEGSWAQKDQKNQSQLNATVYLKNLAKGLERWQLSPVVDADKGVLAFHGAWKDAIYRFSLASLKGHLDLQLNHGRITHLSPETEEKLGLGKLLSILSLQTIPRRLQLDFSDLAHQGYSFDVFKGHFTINQGIMHTEDSYIDGPVAYGSMKGDLDLLRQLYDVDLSISPHITASLPLVATIAGGPLAGVAVWVANNIINQSMQKISAYTYKISGPWKEPVVQQLTIKKASTLRPPERQP